MIDEATLELARSLIDSEAGPLAIQIKEAAQAPFISDLGDYQLQYNRLVELRARMTSAYLSANEVTLRSYPSATKRIFIKTPIETFTGEP